MGPPSVVSIADDHKLLQEALSTVHTQSAQLRRCLVRNPRLTGHASLEQHRH